MHLPGQDLHRVHSTGYKKDDCPSDSPVLGQSVILGSIHYQTRQHEDSTMSPHVA